MKPTDCLIVTDVQNDFCEGGALAVPHADEIVPEIDRIMPLFPLVIATQDWHPADHCSFAPQNGPWPVHCVQGAPGAALHPKLDQSKIHLKIFKATFKDRDAYSAFQETNLADELKTREIRRIFLCGLTTDYCVRYTALDALLSGFQVLVLQDLIRAVDIRPGDGRRALGEIQRAGSLLISSKDLEKP